MPGFLLIGSIVIMMDERTKGAYRAGGNPPPEAPKSQFLVLQAWPAWFRAYISLKMLTCQCDVQGLYIVNWAVENLGQSHLDLCFDLMQDCILTSILLQCYFGPIWDEGCERNFHSRLEVRLVASGHLCVSNIWPNWHIKYDSHLILLL